MAQEQKQPIPPEEQPSEELTPQLLAKKAMDSAGYVIFAGIVSDKKDEKNNPLIDFFYRRYHLGFEDVFAAMRQFRKDIYNDMESIDKDIDNRER